MRASACMSAYMVHVPKNIYVVQTVICMSPYEFPTTQMHVMQSALLYASKQRHAFPPADCTPSVEYKREMQRE
jgi:hypothetical protein